MPSEISFGRGGDGFDDIRVRGEFEIPRARFGAGLFVERTLTPITVLNGWGGAPGMRGGHRLLERGRILEEYVSLQVLAVVDQVETLYDVQLFAMRRPIIIDEGL